MPGMIIGGNVEHVPGLEVANWQDDARLRLKMGEDGRRRPPTVRWLRAIVLHTTLGRPFDPRAPSAGGAIDRPAYPRVLPGAGAPTSIEQSTNRWWSTNGQHGGAHLIGDFDGSFACLADASLEETYHATVVNPYTVGIEIAQREDGSLFEAQLASVVTLCDWLCHRLRIQRQIPSSYAQRVVIPRCAAGGSTVVGVYGHRDVTTTRGFGDPGDAVFARLEAAGYERLDFSRGEDLDAWRRRQRHLGTSADGVAGPATAGAIAIWQQERGERGTGVLTPEQREALDEESRSS